MSDLTSTLSAAENAACGCGPDEDWCALCKRATCHLGEHDEAQLLEFYGQCRAVRTYRKYNNLYKVSQ